MRAPQSWEDLLVLLGAGVYLLSEPDYPTLYQEWKAGEALPVGIEDAAHALADFEQEHAEEIKAYFDSLFRGGPSVVDMIAGMHPDAVRLLCFRFDTVHHWVLHHKGFGRQMPSLILPFPDSMADSIMEYLLVDWWAQPGLRVASESLIANSFEAAHTRSGIRPKSDPTTLRALLLEEKSKSRRAKKDLHDELQLPQSPLNSWPEVSDWLENQHQRFRNLTRGLSCLLVDANKIPATIAAAVDQLKVAETAFQSELREYERLLSEDLDVTERRLNEFHPGARALIAHRLWNLSGWANSHRTSTIPQSTKSLFPFPQVPPATLVGYFFGEWYNLQGQWAAAQCLITECLDLVSRRQAKP